MFFKERLELAANVESGDAIVISCIVIIINNTSITIFIMISIISILHMCILIYKHMYVYIYIYIYIHVCLFITMNTMNDIIVVPKGRLVRLRALPHALRPEPA